MKYEGEELAVRMERFGGNVARICDELPATRSGKHVQDQLLRAGTAVGAHYSEAQGAQSRGDFVHKLSLSLKEAREARHWLGVSYYAGYASGEELDIEGLRSEATQVVAILQAAQRTARDG